MITRVSRLVRGELIKLTSHPFFFISVVLVALSTAVGALVLRGGAETMWRSVSAVTMFAGGAKIGLKLATFVLLIFGAMLFSGEFDRGTIKLLLTRPITRLDLFLAKTATALILSLSMVALVLYVAVATGCSVGELGPVWDTDTYNSGVSYERLLRHAGFAVAMGVGGVVAAAFVGLLVSNVTESSGFAVAMTLTLFVLADEIVLRLVRSEGAQRWFFSKYPDYAFDVLRDFSLGSSTQWREAFVSGAPYAVVPAATAALCAALAFLIFRSRSITA